MARPTGWVPQSKPIWLTEIGCPAVDKGANQPSVFPDPKSAESGLPYFSTGKRDDLIQRRMLEAVLQTFDPAHGATLDEQSGLDRSTAAACSTRPRSICGPGTRGLIRCFPPRSMSGATAPNWETGHWLTGRLGGAPLDALIAAILDDAGIGGFDTSRARGGA